MRASAHKVQVGNGIIAVMRAHIGRLPQHRLQTEGAAQMRRQVTPEIGGRIMEFGDDTLVDVRNQAASDLIVLPVSLGGETIYLAEGVRFEGRPFGPGWQLGLWSIRR